jgi:outer membrane protein OmpA-like peptidoglycan-associated protein
MVLGIVGHLVLSGCSVTDHPEYQKTYFKQTIPRAKLDEVIRTFRSQGLLSADLITDNLGRAQLSGSYQNEREVEKALSIVNSILNADQISTVRPTKIFNLDWEIEAGKEFAKFIEDLAKKYSMSVNVKIEGAEKQILINDIGLGGVEQFDFASPEPTAKAIGFYQQMSKQIVENYGVELGKKKFLIVGHTDDVGDTEKNYFLSEQRARNVGRLFEAAGIKSTNIFFQGAGETLPIEDNNSNAGRSKNRRVEITELSNEANLSKYAQNRQPNINFYRYKSVPQVSRPLAQKPSESTVKIHVDKSALLNKQPSSGIENSRVPEALKQPSKYVSKVNFGGVPYSTEVATLDVGGIRQAKSIFSFISTAQAENISALGDCTIDRPRIAGEVKSLQTNSVAGHKTSDFSPRLYGKTWAAEVNSNLVVLNRVYVLRENGEAPTPPQLNVYTAYKNSNQKPDISPTTTVNSYLVGKGVLYRVFPNQTSGVTCVDVLFPTDGASEARSGRIIYSTDKSLYVANFKPQMQN